jgi:GNAT superfamily N-acetyltransferase
MTTTMRIERARATRKNLQEVHDLIDEASLWLRTKDTKQWAEPWPNKKQRDDRVRTDLERGKTWIVRDEEAVPAATVTLAEEPIPYVWRGCECNLSDQAIYIHRLITARSYAGLGLGGELIDWAGLRGRARYGARWIRIDVWTDNAALHHYYKMAGFEPAGYCADPFYPSGALLQKPTDEIGECAIPPVSGLSAAFVMPSRTPALTLGQAHVRRRPLPWGHDLGAERWPGGYVFVTFDVALLPELSRPLRQLPRSPARVKAGTGQPYQVSFMEAKTWAVTGRP